MGDYNRGGGGRSFGGRGFGPRNFDRGGGRGDRPMFKATCSNCGDACEVPFRPTNGKPVYCSNCFEKMGNGGRSDSQRSERPRFDTPRVDQNQGQFESINAKLDRILKLLEPKALKVNVPAPVVEEVVVVKAKFPKVKKAITRKIK